ncbi:codanin-1-like [Diadema antillarum]|uniref:codanin-1-like n=1 Tax=Diadema antillarum TaxID=105358 RepID=UPI003A8855AB
MAVILEKILAKKLVIKDIVPWLINGSYPNNRAGDVLKDTNLQATEFLSYFINSLRDQTNHLVCRGSATVSSPARTPSSLQKLKRAPSNKPQHRAGSKVNRTQLFAGDANTSGWSDKDFTPVSKRCQSDGNYSVSTPTPRSDGKPSRNVSMSGGDNSSRKKTPGSGSRKDDVLTLAQFMVTPDSQTRGRHRKSPFGDSSFDNTSSQKGSSNKRRSGGRGKQDGSGSKGHKWKQMDAKPPPIFDLESSSDFPPVGSPSKQNTPPTRRITPTALTSVRNGSSSSNSSRKTVFLAPVSSSGEGQKSVFDVSSNQQNAFNPPVSKRVEADKSADSTKSSLVEERELLKQERLRQRTQSESGAPSINALAQSPRGLPPQTPTKLLRSNSVSSMTDAVQPDVEKVLHQDKLDLIAELYASCLQESLVPNLAVELYFLIQLLTAKGSKLDEEDGIRSLDDDMEDVNYLSSIHNCVYFAASVLDRLIGLLSLLDRSTLRLLAENQVVSQFKPQLKSELEAVTSSCPASFGLQTAITSPMQVVPFLADTDNRQNFPSDASFHSFKKHRDSFYGFVRDWEENHSKPGWQMQDKLCHRIRELVRQMDVTNFTHFARLFQSQLVKMCQGDSSVIDSGDSQELSFIQHLKRTNPGKFKRLEDRFSTPASLGGPCPPPAFHGCQEFFRDFIVAADSFTFNQHLMDSFAAKITELNEIQLGVNDQMQTTPVIIDNEQRENFSSCLLALRVLAKFLGFLSFVPYQGGDKLPDTVKDNVLIMRNKTPPGVDVAGCLATADDHQRLILTLPWVVEYLSMMDTLAAQIHHYHQALSLLADIHKRISVQWSEALDNPVVNHNLVLILLLLGWLFENPALPADLHLTSNPVLERSHHGNKPGSDQCLDHLPLVDRHILYTCCPFLGDLRGLLSEANLGMSNRSTQVKKITPVAVDLPSTPVISENQIQAELEQNFFHTHSTSLKKSVEFVSGRVASNCIKFIDGSLVSRARLRVVRELGEVVASGSGKKKEAGSVSARAAEAGAKLSQETQALAREEAKRFVERKCRLALEVLLSCDTLESVLETASAISSRMALERTEKWISTQIPGALQQEVKSQLPKCLRAQTSLPKREGVAKKLPRKPESHDRAGLCPSAVIQHLKECILGVLTSSEAISVDSLHDTVSHVQSMIQSRQDLTPVAYQSIHQLTVELCVALATRYPQYLSASSPVTFPRKDAHEEVEDAGVNVEDTHVHLQGCRQKTRDLQKETTQYPNGSIQSLSNSDGDLMGNQCNIFSRTGESLKSTWDSSDARGLRDLPGEQCNSNVAHSAAKVEKGVGTSLHSEREAVVCVNGDHITAAGATVGDSAGAVDMATTLTRLTLLERLVSMWQEESSPKVPIEAFISGRTAWMISRNQDQVV